MSEPASQPPTPKEWASQFAELARRSELQPLPDAARAALVAHFRAHKRAKRLSAVKRWIATLNFDSADGPQLAGARSGVSAENRQLVYSSDLGDIAIDLAEDKGKLRLSGQLYIDGLDGSSLVQLIQNDIAIVETVADELGEFQFDALTAGTYDLVASTDAYDLQLDAISLEL